jgi:integrase
MAKGSQPKESAWETQANHLQATGCRFRMRRRSDSLIIGIREVVKGKRVSEFTSGGFRYDDDEQIMACAVLCQLSHRAGRWLGSEERVGGVVAGLTWAEFAEAFWERYAVEVPRESSQADHRGYIAEIRKWPGFMSVERLRKWLGETDPFKKLSRHTKQLQLLRDICRYGFLDTRELEQEEKSRRPTRQQLKRLVGKDEPRAIPTDKELFDWLKSINSPLHQWAFAMLTTYGLRPSELWHVNKIYDDGFITVPGYPLCKTFRHNARPTPFDWVEEFKLRENFGKFHAELLKRYKIKWDPNSARGAIPLNNSRVADSALAQKIQRGAIPTLMARKWDGGPDGEERAACAPYDFRHTYAIRLWTHPETGFLPLEKHAWWMGHSTQQHKDIYLKWMPEDRMLEAERLSYEAAAKKAGTYDDRKKEESESVSPEEARALMAEIEKLRKKAAKQRRMIDAMQDEEAA